MRTTTDIYSQVMPELAREAADRLGTLLLGDASKGGPTATKHELVDGHVREKALLRWVELRGLEPLTPTLPVWCATSCAIAP